VNEPLRFHLDEHIPHVVAAALRRHNIDVTTTPEVGLRQADDLTHLTFSQGEGRVLVTHDADFLRHHTEGIEHAGIAYCKKGSHTIGQIIETLRLMHEILSAEEMKNSVEYL
jgi:predicted nuclease of predicted toxin-antitoxin system